MDDHILYPELSYEIIGASMDVHNELGPGWHEWDYHRAMLAALERRGVSAQSHLRKSLQHRAEEVDQMELDILVDGRIVLELKHIKTDFDSFHYIQIINYLKLWDKKLGLLINFGHDRLLYKRVPFSEKRDACNVTESLGAVADIAPDFSRAACQGIENVLELHGAGYGTEVLKKLLFAEFSHMDLVPEYPTASPAFGKTGFESRVLDVILIAERILLMTGASSEGVSLQDVAILKSYLKRTRVQCGMIINVGRQNILLEGIFCG